MITISQIAEALSIYEEARTRRRLGARSAPAAPVYVQGWPAGVLARYRTVGEAYADITYEHHLGLGTRCTACPWTGRGFPDPEVTFYDSPEEAASKIVRSLPQARDAVQEHAEHCRAVPLPEAGDR
ncbi:hypothetical protein [Streptomyces albus]|uniref:hypothetical protein n=1 Tax=Streptomyces albus TaxID=1888 RepID=UPI0033F47648